MLNRFSFVETLREFITWCFHETKLTLLFKTYEYLNYMLLVCLLLIIVFICMIYIESFLYYIFRLLSNSVAKPARQFGQAMQI